MNLSGVYIKKKSHIDSSNFSLCGWSSDSECRGCYSDNLYPYGKLLMIKSGEHHLQGCGNCSQIWTNFNQRNGMTYGNEPVYYNNRCNNNCDLWIWYKDKVEINF